MTQEAELGLRDRLAQLSGVKLLRGTKLSAELERLQRQLERLREESTDEEIWRSVELARDKNRPYTLDYVERILEDWFELHGDRGRMDDHAIVAGIGSLDGRTIALVGHQKGRDLKERAVRNFGMAYPEGYRKAMRTMELANRHGFPGARICGCGGPFQGPPLLATHSEGGGLRGGVARGVEAVAHAPQELSQCRLAPEPARDLIAAGLRFGAEIALPVERLEVVGRVADEAGQRDIGGTLDGVHRLAIGEALQERDERR